MIILSRRVLLSLRNVSVEYRTPRGPVKALQDVSLDVYDEDAVALIGESGSGKTTLGMALLRVLPRAARFVGGEVRYYGRGEPVDVLRLDEDALRRFRWQECALVSQVAMNAMNPVLSVADHFLDTARDHGIKDRAQVLSRARELLALVQLDADRVLRAFPHELSGGMRQRVLIALALLLQPRLIILDEPTTALDTLSQRSVIDLLLHLRQELKVSMLFISHDLSLAAALADRVATMYAGRIVEVAGVFDVFRRPAHPYTLGLIEAIPRMTDESVEIKAIPGSPPNLRELPPGCSFAPRCRFATPACTSAPPPPAEVAVDHVTWCYEWPRVVGEPLPARAVAKGEA